jgi:hypothetical protein
VALLIASANGNGDPHPLEHAKTVGVLAAIARDIAVLVADRVSASDGR